MKCDGWEEVRLGEVVEIAKGRSGERVDNPDEGIAYLGASAIDGVGDGDGFVRATDRLLLAAPDDVVLLWDGERSGLSGWRLTGAVSSTAARLRPNRERLVPGFLASAMENSYGWIQVHRTGQAVPHVPKDLKERLVIPLPPIPEQQKIAAILSSVDDAIAATRQIIEQTKRVKQGLLQTLMTRGIGHTRFKRTKIGEIPEEWEVVPLGAIIDQLMDFRGKTPRKLGMEWGGSIPALSAGNVRMGRIDLSQDCHFGSNDLYQAWMTKGDAKRGDILFTMEAPLGNVAQVPDDERYILSQRVILLRFKERQVANDFMAGFMRSSIFKYSVLSLSTGTTAKGIKWGALMKVLVPVPPKAEQNRIAGLLKAAENSLAVEEKSRDRWYEIKRGLMQDLLTGRVRVPLD